MLDDNQAVASLFQYGHELKGGEPSSDLKFREPSMKPRRMPELVDFEKEPAYWNLQDPVITIYLAI